MWRGGREGRARQMGRASTSKALPTMLRNWALSRSSGSQQNHPGNANLICKVGSNMGEGLLHSSLEVTSIILNMITFQNPRVSIKWAPPLYGVPSTEPQEMFREERGQGLLVLSVQALPLSVTPHANGLL